MSEPVFQERAIYTTSSNISCWGDPSSFILEKGDSLRPLLSDVTLLLSKGQINSGLMRNKENKLTKS